MNLFVTHRCLYSFIRDNTQGIPMRLILRSTSTSLQARLKKKNQASAMSASAATVTTTAAAATTALASPSSSSSSKRAAHRLTYGKGVSVKMLSPPTFTTSSEGGRSEDGGERRRTGGGSRTGSDSDAKSAAAELRSVLQKKQELARLKRRNIKGQRAKTKQHK